MASQMRSTSAMTWSRSLKHGSTMVTSGGSSPWSPAARSVTWPVTGEVTGVSVSVTGSCAVSADVLAVLGVVGCWLITPATLGVVADHVADEVGAALRVGNADPVLRADLDDDQVGGGSPGPHGEVREVRPAGAVGPRGHRRVAGRADRRDVQHDRAGGARNRLALARHLHGQDAAGPDGAASGADPVAGVEHPGGGLGLKELPTDDGLRRPP